MILSLSHHRVAPNNLNLATQNPYLPPLAAAVSHQWGLTISNLESSTQSRTVELVETKEMTELHYELVRR